MSDSCGLGWPLVSISGRRITILVSHTAQHLDLELDTIYHVRRYAHLCTGIPSRQ